MYIYLVVAENGFDVLMEHLVAGADVSIGPRLFFAA